jgi:2'-5' RNA ligase
VRAFVALDVPAAPDGPGSGRAPEHLTLRFLGEIDAPTAAAVSAALPGAAARSSPFRLTLAGVGGFPDLARPRIVFAEVSEGRAEVERLAADVADALALAGLPREPRPFVAHVTLLRVRTPRDRDRARRLVEELGDRTIASTLVEELTLKSSDLTPQGAIHHVIGRWPLGLARPPP